MATIDVEMPPALYDWIQFRVSQGHFADVNAYFEHLIRRDSKNRTGRDEADDPQAL